MRRGRLPRAATWAWSVLTSWMRLTRSSCARWWSSTSRAPTPRSPRGCWRSGMRCFATEPSSRSCPTTTSACCASWQTSRRPQTRRLTTARSRRPARSTRSARPAPNRSRARLLMGDVGGFIQIERHGIPQRDPLARAHDYREFLLTRPVDELREQGARCMDCGVPFCHNGCPLGNLIPDWNDLVYRDRWRDAIAQLHATNNFPEFTGRLCPAPCEAACVLEIREGDSVTIKQIENAIINRAWEEGWVVPEPPSQRIETGQAVAVVGSGPAGMAAAQQLRRAGHSVTLFERDEAIGGLVRFGVPDFKIEKTIVQRRAEQLLAEGVELRCGVDVGRDVSVQELRGGFEAVVRATGSRVPRDLPVAGRELDGVHFAMDYLYQRQRWVQR